MRGWPLSKTSAPGWRTIQLSDWPLVCGHSRIILGGAAARSNIPSSASSSRLAHSAARPKLSPATKAIFASLTGPEFHQLKLTEKWSRQWGVPHPTAMVGATGVEPARIAPKDPKSFASANSATRPQGQRNNRPDWQNCKYLVFCSRSRKKQWAFVRKPRARAPDFSEVNSIVRNGDEHRAGEKGRIDTRGGTRPCRFGWACAALR